MCSGLRPTPVRLGSVAATRGGFGNDTGFVLDRGPSKDGRSLGSSRPARRVLHGAVERFALGICFGGVCRRRNNCHNGAKAE